MDVDRFTRERAAGWDELPRLVRAAGPRPQRLGIGARCCGSAAATARPRRTSRSRAGCSPAIRSRGGSSGSSPTPARASTRPSRAAASLRSFLAHRLLAAACSSGRCALALALALLFVPMALAAVWAVDDPAAALGIVPGRVPGGGRAGRRRRRPVDRRGGRRFSSADLHQQHPRDVPGRGRRHPARARHRGGDDLQRRASSARSSGSRSRTARSTSCCGSCSRTACSSSPASSVSCRGRACGWAGRSSTPGRSRAARRCGARRAPRWRSCSGRCRGSCSRV